MKLQNIIQGCAVAVAVAASVAFTSATSAAYVSGEMGYSTEPVVASGWSYDGVNDLLNTDAGQVEVVGGDLAVLLGTSIVQPAQIDYSGNVGSQIIWTAGDFFFELQSVTVLYEFGNFLGLVGQGQIFTRSGTYEATDARWEFSGNYLTYSAATIAEPPAVVPVPAAAWLFGSALLLSLIHI